MQVKGSSTSPPMGLTEVTQIEYQMHVHKILWRRVHSPLVTIQQRCKNSELVKSAKSPNDYHAIIVT